MMLNNSSLELPKNFNSEKQLLYKKAIYTWKEVDSLSEDQINLLSIENRVSKSNLIRIKGIAHLICELEIKSNEASLILHAGISSLKALANLSPQDLIKKIGRLERQLNTGRATPIDHKTATLWINKAKKSQKEN